MIGVFLVFDSWRFVGGPLTEGIDIADVEGDFVIAVSYVR